MLPARKPVRHVMRLLIDSPAFMAQFERDVAAAERSVCIQVMSFEGDEAGRRLARTLESRPDLDRTLIVDRYSLYDINDRSCRGRRTRSRWRCGASGRAPSRR